MSLVDVVLNVPISEIKIGYRHRKDMGDLKELAKSIESVGLLQPIGVTEDNTLIFGERRFRAVSEILKRDTIPVRIINIQSIVMGEYHENEIRKGFTVSERTEIGKEVVKLLGKRRGSNQHTRNGAEARGESRDIAAKKAGFKSGDQFERASKVLKRGTQELVSAMDEEEISVSAASDIATEPPLIQKEIISRGRDAILEAAKEIRLKRSEENRQKNQRVAAKKAKIPKNKFSCIVIDPPWPMQKIDRDIRPNQVGLDYPTMTIEEIKNFKIGEFSAEDCQVYLWTTQKFLPDAFNILEHWGFKYVFTMVWKKSGGPQPFGLPQYNCEFVLFGRKGNIPFDSTKQFFCCFEGQRREHSRKPIEFYDIVSRVSSGPRIDVFSREKHEGFSQYGNEEGKFNA